jgi:hypothetical protein
MPAPYLSICWELRNQLKEICMFTIFDNAICNNAGEGLHNAIIKLFHLAGFDVGAELCSVLKLDYSFCKDRGLFASPEFAS